MNRSGHPFSIFRKPHEILAANVPVNPFAHSRQRNRSSGGSSVSSQHAAANLLIDSEDDDVAATTSRSRPQASRSTSRSRSTSPPWDGSESILIPLMPMGGGQEGRRDLLSRTPSPCPPRDAEFGEDTVLGNTGLVEWDIGAGSEGHQGLASWFKNGKLGSWLWDTPRGWMAYVSLLIFLYGGSSLLLLVMNRFILWTGVYKFGYPITTTFVQLLMTQLLLYLTASVTRSFSRSLHSLGLGCVVAPSPAPSKRKRRASGGGIRDFTRQIGGKNTSGSAFEFKWAEAKRAFPVALCYSLKVGLSNLSFGYTQLQIYEISRVGTLLVALILTYLYYRSQSLTVTTLSSCITMTLSMAMVALAPGTRFAIEGFIAGVLSTVFVAAYPLLLNKTYEDMLSATDAGRVPSGDLIGVNIGARNGAIRFDGDDKDEARAGWKLLHYANALSILLMFPFLIISGELRDISRNCYILDVAFFWLMLMGAGAAAWATFVTGFLLVRATTPLTVVVTAYPKSALQTVLLMHFKLPTWSWVGCLMCWGSSVWYLVGRRKERGSGGFKGRVELDERPGMA